MRSSLTRDWQVNTLRLHEVCLGIGRASIIIRGISVDAIFIENASPGGSSPSVQKLSVLAKTVNQSGLDSPREEHDLSPPVRLHLSCLISFRPQSKMPAPWSDHNSVLDQPRFCRHVPGPVQPIARRHRCTRSHCHPSIRGARR